jgi:hypothetical protein
MLSFLFLRYLPFNYEESAKKAIRKRLSIGESLSMYKSDLEIELEKNLVYSKELIKKKRENVKEIAISWQMVL